MEGPGGRGDRSRTPTGPWRRWKTERAQHPTHRTPPTGSRVSKRLCHFLHCPRRGMALGALGLVDYTLVLGVPWVHQPIDLEFDPSAPDDLWVASRGDDSFVHLTLNNGIPESPRKFVDYSHSMADAMPALAFSERGTFATCQETQSTANGSAENSGQPPAVLWQADPDVFEASGATEFYGAAVDALTAGSFCTGVAWLEDHGFYVVDGAKGNLEFLDFHRQGEPGALAVSNGKKYRILSGELKREPGVPSTWWWTARVGAFG